LSNALLEAMSTGLPCISSDLEGVKDYVVVHNENALIFKHNDVDGLAALLFKLLNDKIFAEKLGVEARKKIISDFSIERVAGLYSEIYESLLKK